jgi:RNA polymerase sigma-70 factor (ECF subfamily)
VDLDRAFPDLVREHQNAVYSIALRLTGAPADAEDAAQDAFVRAYRALSTYDDERRRALRVRPWLAAITVNVCRNRVRTASRRPAMGRLDATHEPASTGRSVGQVAEDRETAAELATALRRIPEPQRQAVVLHGAGGLTYREISEALGRPEGTVKADVHRGLRALRALLEPTENLA